MLADSGVVGRSNSEFSGIGELTAASPRPPRTGGVRCAGPRRRAGSIRTPSPTWSATATRHAASPTPHVSDCLEHRASSWLRTPDAPKSVYHRCWRQFRSLPVIRVLARRWLRLTASYGFLSVFYIDFLLVFNALDRPGFEFLPRR